MAAVRIAWEERGQGPPLLLVMGLGYARGGWGPASELLAREFRVLAFDNRGIGESETPSGPYTTEDMAADAVSVLDAAGVERAHVVATSLGGMVAQRLALSHPGRVDRLVLVCTTPGGGEAHPMPDRTLRLLEEAAGLTPAAALRRFVENALADATVADRPELVERIYEYRLAHPPDPTGWQAQAAAGATHDALERLGELGCPTLVLHGDEDAVVDVRNAELLATRVPGARLELYPGCGHLLFWEEPERFARDVAAFLREGL